MNSSLRTKLSLNELNQIHTVHTMTALSGEIPSINILNAHAGSICAEFEKRRQTTQVTKSTLKTSFILLKCARNTQLQRPNMTSTTMFVYGSLMAEEVLQILLNRVPASTGATLDGFLRFSIRGKQYPIISQTQKLDNVRGRLLYDISPQELFILDLFEGDEYIRTNVVVRNENDGKHITAAAYIATKDTFDTLKPLLSNEWNYGDFRTNHLASFIKMCTNFKTEL
jgi:gamma-glutamylcyclotransferase (GGCT)/AIG2-like uncharacterized protein YtfP